MYRLYFLILFIYLFIYLWLCWVFVSVRGLSLVVASGGHSSSRCADLPSSRPLLLRSTDSRCAGSVIVAHGPSRSVACGIFPDQGSNPCPLHWQADSQPLRHQGSPTLFFRAVLGSQQNWVESTENSRIPHITASSAIPQQSGKCVIVVEPALTYYHPESIVYVMVHS